jgi:hypothetical protein
LKATAKQQEVKQHSDRDKQFDYNWVQRAAHQAERQPVINVDAKKNELVSNFCNAGRV